MTGDEATRKLIAECAGQARAGDCSLPCSDFDLVMLHALHEPPVLMHGQP